MAYVDPSDEPTTDQGVTVPTDDETDLRNRDAAFDPAASTSVSSAATAPSLSDEVSYLDGLNTDGTVVTDPSRSYWTYDGTTARKWGSSTVGTTGGTVTYYFDPSSNFTNTEKNTILEGLALWSAEARIKFAVATSQASANVLLHRGATGSGEYFSDEGHVAGGRSTTDGTYDGQTLINFDTNTYGFDLTGSFSKVGGYGLGSMIHEMGHLLGLGHGGPYNGNVDPSTDQYSAYDTRLWSLMSYVIPFNQTGTKQAKYYTSYPVTGTNWGNASDGSGAIQISTTPMMLDIMAAQQIYGAPVGGPLSGGNVFGFNSNIDPSIRNFFDFTVDRMPVVTLFDTGTNNTLDLSGFASASTVSLAPGTFSSTSGQTNNIGIAFGTVIDHVVGGSAADTFIGTSRSETFTGGAGADTFTGGGGADLYKDTAADLIGDTITDFTFSDTIDVLNAVGAVTGLAFVNNVLSFMVGLTSVTMTLDGAAGTVEQKVDGTNGGVDIVFVPAAPPTPAAPVLADDDGVSSTDRVTSDPALTYAPPTPGDVLLFSTDGAAYAATAPTFATDGTADGQHTVSVEQQDANGNVSQPGSITFTLDTTPPAIAAVSETGAGIGGDGTGDVPAGTVVTVTVQTDGPVYVTPAADRSTPTLVFTNGGVATYTGRTGVAVNRLTFSYTVQAGQDTTGLAPLNVTGAGDITDRAGNALARGSLRTASLPRGTLAIDTTPPVASSPTLTVAQNGGPTPIGIAAPADALSPAGSLAIVVASLPTNGSVTLADGTTAVTVGQSLTAAQLQGLAFTPTPGLFSQGSRFTYRVTDGAGNAAVGTAALGVGGPGAPAIAGTHASQTTSGAQVLPFSGVSVSDPSTATETMTIAMLGSGGTLADGAGFGGLARNPDGTFGLTGPAAVLSQELGALHFTPTAGAPGTTAMTTFVLTDTSASGLSATDAGTSVAATNPAAAAQPVAPVAVAADRVSIDPTVRYSQGTFTLTGSASSAAGVGSVEISAVDEDGTRQDLGAATLNGDGTFTVSDAIGAHQQSFFEATLTDGAGRQTASADPGLSLQGGLGPNGSGARQLLSTSDGSGVAATSLFRSGGARQVNIAAGGQTLYSDVSDTFQNHEAPSNTFVFDPGHGLDVVSGLRVGGIDHDTLSFAEADFGGSLAAVLQNAHDTKGGVVILDPASGDTVRLTGITRTQLLRNRGDLAFHA